MDQKGCFLPGPILKVYWSILFNRKQIERSWLLVVVHHFKKLPNFHVLWFINALGRTLSMMPRLCCWTFVSWPTKTPKLPTGLLLNAFLFKVKFWGDFFLDFFHLAFVRGMQKGFCGMPPKLPVVHIGELCILHSLVGEVCVSQLLWGWFTQVGFRIMCPKMKHEPPEILLMEEILHHLGWLKPYK